MLLCFVKETVAEVTCERSVTWLSERTELLTRIGRSLGRFFFYFFHSKCSVERLSFKWPNNNTLFPIVNGQ